MTHGGGINSSSPFRQDYAYDEFGNMTSRSGTNGYSQTSLTDTAHYTNMRRDGWTYATFQCAGPSTRRKVSGCIVPAPTSTSYGSWIMQPPIDLTPGVDGLAWVPASH